MSDVISVQLPDGSSRELPAGATTYDLAESIGPRLAKDAVIGVVDGVEVDLDVALRDGSLVEIVTGDSERGLHTIRHSTAHVMAQAILDLYPGTQLAIGPDDRIGLLLRRRTARWPRPSPRTTSSGSRRGMQEIVKADQVFERHELPASEAVAFFADEPYKAEIIERVTSGWPGRGRRRDRWRRQHQLLQQRRRLPGHVHRTARARRPVASVRSNSSRSPAPTGEVMSPVRCCSGSTARRGPTRRR